MITEILMSLSIVAFALATALATIDSMHFFQLNSYRFDTHTKWIFSLAIVMKLFPDALENLRKRNGSADYNAASPIMRQTLVRVVNEDLCHLMPNVKAPTLLCWGTLDDATPLSDGETMEKLMPEAALVKFEGAGHYSFLECQAQFLRVLASFMNIQL